MSVPSLPLVAVTILDDSVLPAASEGILRNDESSCSRRTFRLALPAV